MQKNWKGYSIWILLSCITSGTKINYMEETGQTLSQATVTDDFYVACMTEHVVQRKVLILILDMKVE